MSAAERYQQEAAEVSAYLERDKERFRQVVRIAYEAGYRNGLEDAQLDTLEPAWVFELDEVDA